MNSEDLGGVIATVAIMMIPIVAILTKHQQRMARIIHGAEGQQQDHGQLANLQNDVALLRQQVAQLTLAVDDLRRPTASTVQQRITEQQL